MKKRKKQLILIISYFLVLIICIISGCAPKTKGPPLFQDKIYIDLNPPRSYIISDDFDSINLQDIIESIFVQAGFNIALRISSRGYFKTNWIESKGDIHGFTQWAEQRMYEVHIDPDRLMKKKYFLTLTLHVQECAPVSSGWQDKKIIQEADEQYLRILKKIDDVLQKTKR